MRQYCECTLAVLDDDLSNNWDAHLVFMYYHLLHDPRYCLPWKLSYVNLNDDLSGMNVGGFGVTILHATGLMYGDSLAQYSNNITEIFHDLIGDIKMEEIFAKSASFCLALLCDEQCASQDVGHIYGIDRHDRRKKREHPWHWRQMVPRTSSLGNRLALIGYRQASYMDYKLKLTRIRKALRTTIYYRYENTRVIPMREYFEVKSEPVPKTWPEDMKDKQPQQWPLFIFLLDLLPCILPLAGRYEPLVDMCRKKCLSSLSQVWPKKSRRARQAIDSYLRRMDLQEEMEM
ncbi:hypothetical protein CPC08DRAFT_547892 [Agrocybe pediades]|nr:hypothetical protein CPC08DRAFT_547892 [Agrocybe pediades]